MNTIIYLHGFASSSQGTKAVFLRERCQALPEVQCYALDFTPTPRDFEFMTVSGMIARLRQFILDRELPHVSLIGSSLGGLPALHYAARYEGVRRVLLLAPALFYRPKLPESVASGTEEGTFRVYHHAFQRDLPLRQLIETDGESYRMPIPPAVPTRIIHGIEDAVIPIEHSRQYAARYPEMVSLIAVPDTHMLHEHLPLFWEQVQSFLLG